MRFPWNGRHEEQFAELREAMVLEQIERRGITDRTVLDAMRTVPRHFFVPESSRADAYADGPLSIGHGQTISQPYVVASMTEALRLDHRSRVLEVGTGSGYQTAVLAEIAARVYSIEILPDLSQRATVLLARLGYTNIETSVRNGYHGWPEEAPFDGIIVTAAASHVPPDLLTQMAETGRLVIPVQEYGPERQDLVLVERTDGGLKRQVLYQVRFVPLVEEGGLSDNLDP
ncbi:MAG: protein-L-isoaspartate(D-aspartate) O-methyltransferase [Candidatus Zixiibacteriota bacterium]